ncbi:hypothetical protein D3C72_2096580 [compost metagenome]
MKIDQRAERRIAVDRLQKSLAGRKGQGPVGQRNDETAKCAANQVVVVHDRNGGLFLTHPAFLQHRPALS